MSEPVLFALPLHLLLLYFFVYACLGWIMETTYCSVVERRFVVRGFLYGPICPIYGAGVLMMLCWFAPLLPHPLLFYLLATACMSALEYTVGWLLEATTHIKYWDYSHFRFNLHGRICLWVCLLWGVLAYVMLYWVHPFVSGRVLLLPLPLRRGAAGVLTLLLLVDTALTIRDLALMSKVLRRLSQAGEELRLQLALGRAQLNDRLDAILDAAPGTLDEAAERLRARYADLLAKAERRTRRFLASYSHMSSQLWSDSLSTLRTAGVRLRRRLREIRRQNRRRRR